MDKENLWKNNKRYPHVLHNVDRHIHTNVEKNINLKINVESKKLTHNKEKSVNPHDNRHIALFHISTSPTNTTILFIFYYFIII